MSKPIKERPVLFQADMIRAVLAGTKTQTRRVVKPQPAEVGLHEGQETYGGRPLTPADVGVGPCAWSETGWAYTRAWNDDNGATSCTCRPAGCPYGAPGDRLYVREAFRLPAGDDSMTPVEYVVECEFDSLLDIRYEADGHSRLPDSAVAVDGWGRLRPSIHLPRRLSRLLLEITEVRVERVQEITPSDAADEGVSWTRDGKTLYGTEVRDSGGWLLAKDVRDRFAELWDQINGPRGYGWEADPWAWAVTFEVVRGDEVPS